MKYYLISLTRNGFPNRILEEFDNEQDALTAFKEAERESPLRDYCSKKDLLKNEEGPQMLVDWKEAEYDD